MPEPVKPRAYRSPVRASRAAATRRAVLDGAQELFLAGGYPATTARGIAAIAGVSVDTVYASIGRKPEVMLALLERAISGGEGAVAPDDRAYVQAVAAARTAPEKLAIYAAAMRELVPRLAPLVAVLKQAGAADPECAAVWAQISSRRAANMRRFAADLRSTGEVRDDLSDDDIADIIWSTNAPEFYLLLVERQWTPERYERLLVDVWTRTLLKPST